MSTLVSELIADYERSASEMLGSLKNNYKIDNPVRSVIEKIIPRSGLIDGNITYSVHGTGVRFEANDNSEIIDVDLSVDGNYAGFDSWRLFSFAKSKEKYQLLSESDIKFFIVDMVETGKLAKNPNQMTSHLYIWVQ